MKLVFFLVLFMSSLGFSKVEVSLNQRYSISFSDFDFALPLSNSSYILKSFDEEKVGILSINNIYPMTVKEIEALVRKTKGNTEYDIREIGGENFYFFYSKKSVFYYSPRGLLIQIRSQSLNVKSIKMSKV